MKTSKRPYRLISRRSCLLLARTYQEGLNEGKWKTQLGALNTLRVSQGDLSLALQLQGLPNEVLDLFDDRIGISSHTVRVIRHTIIHDGIKTVLARIRHSGATNAKHSNKTVLKIVKGQALNSKAMLRWSGQDPVKIAARALDLPKNISDRYHLGVTNGEWASFSACAKALGISRRNVSVAVSIRELPDPVRHLFYETDLTFAVGKRLLALKDELGLDEMLVRARSVESMFDASGRTAANILSELNAENIRPSTFTRVRIKKGRGRNRLVIECKDSELLWKYRAEIEKSISKVLKKRITDAEFVEVMREFGGIFNKTLLARLPSTFAPRPS
ncbi:hypothetical protein [Caballeronia sp. INML2]|uniref:hypothetical protein n=1 Tax=Caballeronia sp. INML2 TaxID=2921748 RepID=UPI002028FC77|nr:hypothetical protein [Caballeronia sp. INML2]